MRDRMKAFLSAIAVVLVMSAIVTGGGSSAAVAATCTGGSLPVKIDGEDLEVTGDCTVGAGTYKYGNVNIYGTEQKPASLTFQDATIEFWAKSILVENHGSLLAGSDGKGHVTPIAGPLTIYLYGEDQTKNVPNKKGTGILCTTPLSSKGSPCGIDDAVWIAKDTAKCNRDDGNKCTLPGGVVDYFYQYHSLPYDGADTNAYFGYKVLALSYGGTIQLFGKRGATYASDGASSSSGTSWARLAKTIDRKKDTTGDKTLVLDRAVDWQVKDQIVVTTTDYLPGHSERLSITGLKDCDNNKLCKSFDFVRVDEDTDNLTVEGVKWRHNGDYYGLSKVPSRLHLDIKISNPDGTTIDGAAEIRAAVALLTRSIRIVSAGKTKDDLFPAPNAAASSDNYFGGHTIVRQGFLSYQIQGVEFTWLGQGGRLGHYPVHFHMARRVPKDTFVKDSSVNESMTRWIVLHATQGVTLARNVGYRSIGHGYYLEEGSETDNLLHSNIGIFARAAVANKQNSRQVPGILVAPDRLAGQETPAFNSDYTHPTVFWIMNGWNDFEYNMAAGAGTCGVCYWLLSGVNSGMSRTMKWEGYAGMQATPGDPNSLGAAGTTPLKTFVGNYCSSAMTAFQSIGATAPCIGVPLPTNLLKPIKNDLAPAVTGNRNIDSQYYPTIDDGIRTPTLCHAGEDCAVVVRDHKCGDAATPATEPLSRCAVTVLDRFTTAFNFQETNFAAVWLRKYWFLVTNSVISDMQNAGLTFVTGGGYTKSDVTTGQWQVVRKSAFIGHTQKDNPYASAAGPFSPGGLKCDNADFSNHCLAVDEGISFQLTNFSMAQRAFNIYDGPAYQDSNAYLDITETELDCEPSDIDRCCKPGTSHTAPCTAPPWGNSDYAITRTIGIPYALNPRTNKNVCYLPNAAIAWKQPNGFYYPPAFHSTNLFFDNVGIRHFVIQPLLDAARKTDVEAVKKRYCRWNSALFEGWTDVDRQTELNDDDGSLTGFVDTISVNEDTFFNAPTEAFQCASDLTAKTSPYDYVSTVVFPTACGSPTAKKPSWAKPMEDLFIRSCQGFDGDLQLWGTDGAAPAYGVPIYRQYLTSKEVKDGKGAPEARMAGQGNGQRSVLTANHGSFYIDTTVSQATQAAGQSGPQGKTSLNVFTAKQEYNVFLVYTKATTEVTYQLYVGENRDKTAVENGVKGIRVKVPGAYQFEEFAFPVDKGWTRSYDSSNGVLTVVVKLSSYASEFNESRMNQCGPLSYCKWKGTADSGQCACNTDAKDHLFNRACEDSPVDPTDLSVAVCAWASKDVDCPTKGCFGFRFTLPEDFKAANQSADQTKLPDKRAKPNADPFPQDGNWNKFFRYAPVVKNRDKDDPIAGACQVQFVKIDFLRGQAAGVGGPNGKASVTLNGSFSPPATFDLAVVQNVTLNALLHERPEAESQDLVTDFLFPIKLFRVSPNPTYDASFSNGGTETTPKVRLDIKAKGSHDRPELYLRVDNISIDRAAAKYHCGSGGAEVYLTTSLGLYDASPPIDVEVEGDWDCSNAKTYVGHN